MIFFSLFHILDFICTILSWFSIKYLILICRLAPPIPLSWYYDNRGLFYPISGITLLDVDDFWSVSSPFLQTVLACTTAFGFYGFPGSLLFWFSGSPLWQNCRMFLTFLGIFLFFLQFCHTLCPVFWFYCGRFVEVFYISAIVNQYVDLLYCFYHKI